MRLCPTRESSANEVSYDRLTHAAIQRCPESEEGREHFALNKGAARWRHRSKAPAQKAAKERESERERQSTALLETAIHGWISRYRPAFIVALRKCYTYAEYGYTSRKLGFSESFKEG